MNTDLYRSLMGDSLNSWLLSMNYLREAETNAGHQPQNLHAAWTNIRASMLALDNAVKEHCIPDDEDENLRQIMERQHALVKKIAPEFFKKATPTVT